MAVYLVTWDLNKEKPNYAQARANLIEALQKFSHVKDEGLDSVWFISTAWDAQQVYNYLAPHLHTTDHIIVSKMHVGTTEHQGWLAKETWSWINGQL